MFCYVGRWGGESTAHRLLCGITSGTYGWGTNQPELIKASISGGSVEMGTMKIPVRGRDLLRGLGSAAYSHAEWVTKTFHRKTVVRKGPNQMRWKFKPRVTA